MKTERKKSVRLHRRNAYIIAGYIRECAPRIMAEKLSASVLAEALQKIIPEPTTPNHIKSVAKDIGIPLYMNNSGKSAVHRFAAYARIERLEKLVAHLYAKLGEQTPE
jgi:hypothetical protein